MAEVVIDKGSKPLVDTLDPLNDLANDGITAFVTAGTGGAADVAPGWFGRFRKSDVFRPIKDLPKNTAKKVKDARDKLVESVDPESLDIRTAKGAKTALGAAAIAGAAATTAYVVSKDDNPAVDVAEARIVNEDDTPRPSILNIILIPGITWLILLPFIVD